MTAHALDNPIWTALTTRHRKFALGGERVRRYPADIGPFVAVPTAGLDVREELHTLVAPGESVDVVGVAPAFPAQWQLLEHAWILQMVCEHLAPAALRDAAAATQWRELSVADRPAMLELTALVYPAYFRSRTNELGRYIGIYQEGRLAAMAGERMGTDTHIEISAVCTHPQFVGRGYAGLLVSTIARDIQARGCTAFLHVSEANSRAIGVYERLGFTTRAHLPLWLVQRPG